MQTYDIYVKGRTIYANSADMALVRTSVGVDQVHVLFDNIEWLGFPVSVTFAQGGDAVTRVLAVTEVTDSEWRAEGTMTVPYEVVDMVGPIWVTIHGTDEDGNRIITAKGAPLRVEEEGYAGEGIAPSETVTPSELEQAYALAMEAVNQAASLVENLRNQIDDIVSGARDDITRIYGNGYGPATKWELGLIKVGEGLSIAPDGTLTGHGGMTKGQLETMQMLVSLANGIADFDYDNGSVSGVSVRQSVLPVATDDSLGIVKTDGVTTYMDDDGTLHAYTITTVPTATAESAGGVMPDGVTTTVGDGGVMSVLEMDDETIDALTPFKDILPDTDSEGY